RSDTPSRWAAAPIPSSGPLSAAAPGGLPSALGAVTASPILTWRPCFLTDRCARRSPVTRGTVGVAVGPRGSRTPVDHRLLPDGERCLLAVGGQRLQPRQAARLGRALGPLLADRVRSVQ